MADILNRIVPDAISILGDVQSNNSVSLWIGFTIPLAAFIVVVLAAIGYDCIIIRRNKKRNHNQNWCQSAAECTKLFIKICTLFGGILYYVGDNLETAVNAGDNLNTTINAGDNLKTTENTDVLAILSPALSISGIVFLRIFTRALRTLQKHCKAKQRMPDAFNLWSPNHDTETHSMVVIYVNLLTFLIEFDTVLSVLLQMFDNDNFCNNTDQKALVWSFYGIMIVIFWIIQLIIVIIFVVSASCPQCKEKANYPFTVDSTCNVCYVIWNVVLSVGVTLAVASDLFAEISQLLQCYMSIPPQKIIPVRFALSLFVFLVCLMVCVGFLFRKLCGCVQVKGELEAVNVTDNEIEVCYKVKYPCYEDCRCKSSEAHTCTYTFNQSKYDYSKNPTFSEELYTADVKGIVNFVNGPVKIHTCECKNIRCTCGALTDDEYEHIVSCLQSATSVVKVQKDLNKIGKVHKFGEQPYLVVRTTDDPTIHVYKVRVPTPAVGLDIITNGLSRDALEVQYVENGTNYKIYTYHLKQQNVTEERKYAVRIQDTQDLHVPVAEDTV
jgi:uncharacterized membrane protein